MLTITTNEAANMLNMSSSGVFSMIHTGKLRTESVGRRRYVALSDVVAIVERRRYLATLLDVEEVGRLLGYSAPFICREVGDGKLALAARDNRGKYLMERAEVDRYWREEMAGRCVRCTILEEATPERDFLCVACEHEVRTGQTYTWPVCTNGARAVPKGRLWA